MTKFWAHFGQAGVVKWSGRSSHTFSQSRVSKSPLPHGSRTDRMLNLDYKFLYKHLQDCYLTILDSTNNITLYKKSIGGYAYARF